MSTHEENPLAHPEVRQANFTGYFSGYIASIAFLLAALLMTEAHALSPLGLMIATSGLAMLALIAQTLFFFGIDFSPSHIWKTVSLVLTVPLFILSIGLTVWMFHYLYALTMMPGMDMQPTLLQ